MAVTFKDVAKLAGVSTQTVSRVTNGSDSVSESTRKKVNDAIEQLGYVPNKGAQMLSRAKSNILGVISLDISLHGVAMIDSGIRQQAQIMGFSTALSVVPSNDINAIRTAIREMIAQQAESIIINAPLSSQYAEDLVEQFRSLRLTFIDVPPGTDVNYVCCAHRDGAMIAATHLLNHHRSQFLFVTGPDESTASQLRFEGWQEAIQNSNAKVVYQHTGDWQSESGYLAIKQAIAKRIEFDAVLVASDQMALGVICALNEHGISIPNQVSVVGFDGIADGAYFTPSLSTIEQDFISIGKQAVAVALDDQGLNKFTQIAIPVDLVARSSSGEKSTQSLDIEAIRQQLKQIDTLLMAK